MARIRKRGNSYQIDYFDPIGKRIRKSFSKKKEAEAELGKRVSLIAEKRYLDVKKECKTTFKQLLDKYEENYNYQRSFKRSKKTCLENFSNYFGENTLLSNIKYVDLETYRNHLRQKITPRKTVRTNASTNREMTVLHHAFSKAVEWEMIERSPFERGKTLLVKENNKRLRYLAEEEIENLLRACPVHLRNIVVCAVNTGMRKGEILSLKWSQIRNNFIYLEKTKTDEPRQIPVNETLAELFKEIRKRQKFGSEYIFTYMNTGGNRIVSKMDNLKLINVEEGDPVKNIKSSFKSALKRAGIVNFRFHDLRHTFASHLLMKGGNLKDVQELLGHKTMTMTLRYAHLSQEHKRKAVNLLNGLTAKKNDDMSQNVTNGENVTSIPPYQPYQVINSTCQCNTV